jgi:hypothetical protein
MPSVETRYATIRAWQEDAAWVRKERRQAALSSAAPPSRAALPPIFDVQPRHLVKIAQIARQHQGLVLQGNRRNFQIHRPDPYTLLPQLGKGGGRPLIKREHLLRRKEAHQAQQALIVRHLPCDLGDAVEQR